MTKGHLNRILCAADPRGSPEATTSLLNAADRADVDVIALGGDLACHDGYGELFRALAAANRPVFWVPGPGDAPIDRCLREAHSFEAAFPSLHGVHGTAAFASGELIFAGFGGEVSDDPMEPRDEEQRLRYPRWEPEYRLKLVRELDYNELVLLFWSSAARKRQASGASGAVAEMIGTYRPRLALCGGERGVGMVGTSIVVTPGSLADGYYAVANLREGATELEQLSS